MSPQREVTHPQSLHDDNDDGDDDDDDDDDVVVALVDAKVGRKVFEN